eukprot:TRINITY_DN16505_c0_g1_i1.p2 TRINITY_DN16505_c0_g1~~TRINITY_DN16505_c0_g1_i1.p2  ORF type:complete len:399 (+),score=134.64 TRINITY_DN16505_c0_g1_i1:172-1368(+)
MSERRRVPRSPGVKPSAGPRERQPSKKAGEVKRGVKTPPTEAVPPPGEGDAGMEGALARMIAHGQAPLTDVVVQNDDTLEVVVFEALQWGLLAAYQEKQRARVGKVTGVVANQTLRQVFIHGPGLPPWGVGLLLSKAGFRQSIYKLEDVCRKTGVPCNFYIESVPSPDLTIEAALARKAAPAELPKCLHRNDAVLALIGRFAEAKQDRGAAQLKAFREQLRGEGVGIDEAAEVWFTKDGRGGRIPWVDAPETTRATGRRVGIGAGPARPWPSSHPKPAHGVDLASSILDGSGAVLSPLTVGADGSVSPRGGSFRGGVPSGERLSPRVADGETKRSLRNVNTLVGDKPAVGPSSLHIPPGQAAVLELEPGLRPLRILLHEGGRVLNEFKIGSMENYGDH